MFWWQNSVLLEFLGKNEAFLLTNFVWNHKESTTSSLKWSYEMQYPVHFGNHFDFYAASYLRANMEDFGALPLSSRDSFFTASKYPTDHGLWTYRHCSWNSSLDSNQGSSITLVGRVLSFYTIPHLFFSLVYTFTW